MVEGGGKRVVARLALFAALLLAVGVVFALVEVQVSLRWSGGGGGGGGGGGRGGFSVSVSSNNNRAEDTKNVESEAIKTEEAGSNAFGDEVDLEPPDAPWTGQGKRAYAVVFPDVHDPLVLERALALWRSLEALKGDGEDVVAIVPRFFGEQLFGPLVNMGYRVLPRESPAPPWRATGRFVQRTITAIGTGWGSGSGGHGWSLLALEALALTEYEEVVVLDQKVVILPPIDLAQSPRRLHSSGSRRRATILAADPGQQGRPTEQQGRGMGGLEEEGSRGRHLGEDGGGDGGKEGEGTGPGETRRATASAAGADGPRLPQLVPHAGVWSVAFAEGADSALAQGPGLRSLPEDQQSHFGGQHPALMAVRPDADLYKRISELLCKGDEVFSEAFSGMPTTNSMQTIARDKVWERRAPTVPLLHLAVGMTSGSDASAAAAKLPLEVCGGGDEFDSEDAAGGEGDGEGGDEWRWIGATSPVVWCPTSAPQDQGGGDHQRRRQRRRLGDRAAIKIAESLLSGEAEGGPADGVRTQRGWGGDDTLGAGAERTDSDAERRWGGHRLVREALERGQSPADAGTAAAAVMLGKRGGEQQRRRLHPGLEPARARRGGGESLRADRTGVVDEGDGSLQMLERGLAGHQEGEEGQGGGAEEGVEKDEREEGGEGGEARAGEVGLAWIPGDPCSCVNTPGTVGEACRGWLMARARANFSPSRGGKSSDAESVDRQGAERDLLMLALSACEDGEMASPLQPPEPPQQAARAAATAGAAAHSSWRSSPGGGDGANGGSGTVPPPLWQEVKPKNRPVVTQEDMRAFQHFWVANVEKKLLMVAIPKVACTQVHALFLRMQGSANWNSPHMHEIHYHKDMDKYKVKTMPDMTPERVSSILTDPSWTKAVFLRDPAERLLSCFLDKIVHRKSYSVKIFHANDILSFESFVELTSKDAPAKYQEQYPGAILGLSRKSNPHWKPQLYFGLDKFLPYFDFIGDFKHVGAHSEELLRRAGLWDDFGASGWGPSGNAAFFQRSTVQGHATGSRDSKSQYYTPPLLASVREAYAPTDYKLMAGLGWWNETTRA